MEDNSLQQVDGPGFGSRNREFGGPGPGPSWQEDLLCGVSRTFALTIPQLPDGLREAVTNAYLLCRIADTIEDDPIFDAAEKDRFHSAFLEAVERGRGAREFARELAPRLAPSTLSAEVELIQECPQLLGFTATLDSRQQRAVHRCLSMMSHGMAEYERCRSRNGLSDVREFERYCYFVAGVVGEMLTELFCDYSPEIDARRDDLERRAVSFGLGLQMTNILKDVWADLDRGVCWLPREIFDAHGYDLDRLGKRHDGCGSAFADSMQVLIGIAHDHLRNALDYTLAIPNHEVGIRRFLIWAVLLAVSTLGKISASPLFQSGAEVKVSRRRVAAIVTISKTVIRSNCGLTTLFNTAAYGLPRSDGHRSPILAERT